MVFASQIFQTEEQERAFREKVEGLLRNGEAGSALAEIDARLGELSANPLARVALAVDPAAVAITGWHAIARNIASLDVHGQPISAVSIDLADPASAARVGDDAMQAPPILETAYYCDEVFPFSTSDRGKLASSYGRGVVRWRDKHDHRDREIGVVGLDSLYAAYRSMKPYIDRGELTELADYDAPRLSAMRAAVLLHMAVARAVAEEGLPHPLLILCGSDEDYPYFDAPVTTRDEYDEATDAQAEAGDTDEALFTSLATLAPVRPSSSYRFEAETEHLSGRSLRHKLKENANDAGETAPVEEAKPSLFGRLFRRSA